MPSGGGAGALMSCVREGSLEPPYRPPQLDTSRHGEGRTNRFLRGLRRMFRRRSRRGSPDKSCSTSELLDADRRRKEGAYSSGLSVSHDSVFTAERSGDESDHADAARSHRVELVAAVRRRGRGDASDDDEDLGLPRSPPASPPTDKADKRHHAGISQSSCSDGSLLSVGSSEMDDDSGSHHERHERHHERHERHHEARGELDHYAASEPPTGVAPLSHSAARHKMAVRPRRTRPPPRRSKNNQIAASALPITPEVNEEVMRSTTPDAAASSEVVTESFSSTTTKLTTDQERAPAPLAPDDAKAKSSSLPPGLALSQLGPPRLTLAATPRSSVKRSKSSSQGTREEIPNSTSESQLYHEERRFRSESRYEEPAQEKKLKKTEEKKKEESFFSRLLLRKSGKKKKEGNQEESQDGKKTKEKGHYKSVETERCSFIYESYSHIKEKTPKAAQKAPSNKRADNKGAYIQEGVYKEPFAARGVFDDLKVADETDKMLNREMKRYSRREEYAEKVERSKRTSSKEHVEDTTKRESFTLHGDRSKKPPASLQRLVEPYPKAFTKDELLPKSVISAPEPIKPRMKGDYSFHSGSMPKNIPYFNPHIVVSCSASPPKSVLQEARHFNRSSEQVSEYGRERKHFHTKAEETYQTTGMRSLGEEFETRGSIAKSHSFRYASETTSISSQESQMPSLPAIVGISEPLLESWEVNYRRNVNERHDFVKRLSARNYVVNTAETNYDSLPSTDSSYLDSLKTESHTEEPIFANTVHVTVESKKRDSDISQIEAKIDDIISSPKPIIASILKSSSLDSVKSTPEKPVDDRRKTIAVESEFSHKARGDAEGFVSVTHINREQTPTAVVDKPKSDEKLTKTGLKPGVPEFLKIQLNRVDVKPATNVVLTANVTPKKAEPEKEKSQEMEVVCEAEAKTSHQIQIRKETVKSKLADKFSDNSDERDSPVVSRRSFHVPQSPSSAKAFFKRKSTSVDFQEKGEKTRTNSVSTDGSTEKIFDSISVDQKSQSSFGSKTSIQSTDSSEVRTDRQDDTVVYRKKAVTLVKERSKRNDDEPELMKVFARRSLKLKDSEAEIIAQEIADARAKEHEAANSKLLKNEFNASIKSRDSDKENDDSKESDDNKIIDIAARVSQFGQYQRSVSVTVRENKNEVNKYKKEVSDSTPEKRLRNRTFPDTSNEELKIKTDAFKADTLKRPWQTDDATLDRVKSETVVDKDGDMGRRGGASEREGAADATPQFKGILQMRAEWERRAKGMTK